MGRISIFDMDFRKVYDALCAKAMRKGRTAAEVNQIISWLCGWPESYPETIMPGTMTYGDFFRKAPAMNPLRFLIKGSICGVKISQIDDPLMKDIRILDKMIDELAKGKSTDQICRKG